MTDTEYEALIDALEQAADHQIAFADDMLGLDPSLCMIQDAPDAFVRMHLDEGEFNIRETGDPEAWVSQMRRCITREMERQAGMSGFRWAADFDLYESEGLCSPDGQPWLRFWITLDIEEDTVKSA